MLNIMPPLKYSLNFLKEVSEKYGFKILNNHDEHFDCNSKIKGTCITLDCQGTFEKKFHTLCLNDSFYCKDCLKKVRVSKLEKTNQERYGVKNVSQVSGIKEQKKDTTVKNYGVKNPSQSSKIKQKKEDTSMKNYGVKYANQNSKFAEHNSKNSFKLKEYVFPSGKLIKLQGYEPQALDILLKEQNINEDDILTSRSAVPEIWYKDDKDVKHRHFVDFYIKSLNKCIEVKSSWTKEKKKDIIYLKQKAAKALGYEYEIWIMNKKGKLLELIY